MSGTISTARAMMVAGVGCLASFGVAAQVATIPNPGQEETKAISIGGQFNQAPLSSVDVYTVPKNSSFHLTDLILTNYGSSPCDVDISGKTYEIRVGPSSTLVVNMVTGPVFNTGEKVTLVNTWRLPGHGDSCEPIYTVMGYLSKKTP